MSHYYLVSALVFTACLVAEIYRGRYGFQSDRHLAAHCLLLLTCILTCAVTLVVQILHLP